MKGNGVIKAAKMLKAAANEKRLSILLLIKEQEMSVGQIEEMVDLSQSALSQHLAISSMAFSQRSMKSVNPNKLYGGNPHRDNSGNTTKDEPLD